MLMSHLRVTLRTPRVIIASLVLLFALAPSSAAAKPSAGASASRANSADRMIFWSGCSDLVSMTDANLRTWASRGVGGFSCNVRSLFGLGGDQRYTSDLTKLHGKAFALERALHKSDIVKRAHELGLKLYLGFYFANSDNPRTPLAEWDDDQSWTGTVVPQVRNFAAAAHSLGFDGVAVDQELYPQRGGRSTASWDWDFRGNRRSEKEVRALAVRRGAQIIERAARRLSSGADPRLRQLLPGELGRARTTRGQRLGSCSRSRCKSTSGTE